MPKRLPLLLTAVALVATAVVVTPAAGQQGTGGFTGPVHTLPVPGSPLPDEAEAYGYASEIVAQTQADTWHLAGHRGAGVQVGIIGEFDQAIWDAGARWGELPPRSSVGTFCSSSVSCTVYTSAAVGAQGTALAEVVHDMAPDADLRLARLVPTARSEYAGLLQEAVDWFVAEGVDVILRPDTGVFDGPGDGTGPIDAVLDDAVAAGVTVVQAGSHSGDGGHLLWEFADEDGDDWLEFAPGDERLLALCGAFSGLRWDDFGEGSAATDYDLYQYAQGGSTSALFSENDQQAPGVLPVEHMDGCEQPWVELGIKVTDAGAAVEGDLLELLGDGMFFEYNNWAGSATGPGEDSANPGVLTVGSVASWDFATHALYSSHGPTRDGRLNPDLTARSCVSTFSVGEDCFDGMGAAAAVVAGAAALRLADVPDATPAEIATWLTLEATVDKGIVGPDNAYGHGQLVLPSMGPRPVYRPDARIRGAARDGLIGNNLYNTRPARQRATLAGPPGREVRFSATLENDGSAPERFVVGGSSTAFGYRIAYFRGSTNVTGAVTRGDYVTSPVPPGGTFALQIRVRIPTRPTAGGIQGALRIYGVTTFEKVDTVYYVARLP